jgi:hypothetical protein
MRREPQGNIELVPEKQVLDFNSAPRAERVDDQHRKQMTECKHHSNDALILPHCANPPRMRFSGASGNLSNKIIQKGLEFRCDRSATVLASGARVSLTGIRPAGL